ncbi:MAG: hypothetical protein K2Y23_01695 [Cyanobacteria bacterium]|nr:hypothetical protein [Cyanobacteriota bacterium]
MTTFFSPVDRKEIGRGRIVNRAVGRRRCQRLPDSSPSDDPPQPMPFDIKGCAIKKWPESVDLVIC